MNHTKKKRTAYADGDEPRYSRTLRDDRGAPADRRPLAFDERPEGGLEALSLEPEETYDPYDRKPVERPRRPKRDLRKLSEWIQMMRQLEERRRRGEDD